MKKIMIFLSISVLILILMIAQGIYHSHQEFLSTRDVFAMTKAVECTNRVNLVLDSVSPFDRPYMEGPMIAACIEELDLLLHKYDSHWEQIVINRVPPVEVILKIIHQDRHYEEYDFNKSEDDFWKNFNHQKERHQHQEI